ncbi:histidine kinase [Clostridium estertheticum]|uniref:sensor histidine kinase n=1 Tax=Clostridium estertheticum TaxID=238834 RepID=UPI001CF5DD7D|nr:histidine kinase [Clostridium estertheticum]MCB2307049.1 histidine kinase [Clostridium estertheticum]MCB2345857.1 histidine kinase [Clostridium estertheticum]MCB2350551.1 histidine kinase [Clostridium estertheticum]WAG45459.1 histidine kinase [Clostridium estertheticum]
MKKGLFNFINDIHLNSKFLIIYIFCVLVPILTVNLIFWNRISNDIKERETENYNISINRAKTDIFAILEGSVYVSNSVSSDKDLYVTMEKSFNGAREYYETYYDLLRDRINRCLPVYNNILQVIMYTSNDTIVSGGSYYTINQQTRNALWYKDVRRSGEKVALYTYRDRTDDGSGNYVQYLSVLRRLNDFEGSGDKYEHVLKIDIDMNKLYNIFDREKNYLDLFLVDPKGRIVCSSGHKSEGDLSKGYTKFNDIYVSEKNINFLNSQLGTAGYLNGWNIIGIPNRNHILNESHRSNIFIAGITAFVILMSTFLILIIVRSYNYRLKKLSKHMMGVKNQNFELIQIPEGKDEIGELIFSFNIMTSKINTLVNDVYKLQIKEKDLEIQRVHAELKFLQSQVDPHFLFNTLNAVMAICVKNKYTDLIDVIKYLSKIFRRLISWKEDLVTVREEISFTEMYLKIEKFRFLEKFDYKIELDEKALDFKIPKMSIQTLIENACKHGIQSIVGVGIVKIKVSQTGEFLFIDVEDNGSGIEDDKLQEIIESLSSEDDFCENVGIRNVYKRLHLYYGDEVEFNIKSEMNKGTIVHYGINKNAININKYTEGKTD